MSFSSRCHLVIPMSGSGARFTAAGTTTPKPLISVDGRPIIQHILERFPGISRCTFICSRTHALETPLIQVLKALKPDADIRIIEPHRLGPVHAVRQVYDLIDDRDPVIVNYCDFNWVWNFSDFLEQMFVSGADGCVVGYHGFHPHLVGPDLYATMRVQGNRVREIREKHAFSQDRFQEFTSSGTYYFARGRELKTAFDQLVAGNLSLNGEFYCSTPFQLMIEAGKEVAFYPVERFCQWGTPGDLNEYQRWSSLFARRVELPSRAHSDLSAGILLMAGLGERFQRAGYSTPKPFIPVSGIPMALQALVGLPRFRHLVAVARTEHQEWVDKLFSRLQPSCPGFNPLLLDTPTRGQACTARLALELLPPHLPVLVASCDNSLSFDHSRFQAFLREQKPQVVVFSARGQQIAARYPERYGWIRAEGGRVTGISTKVPVSDSPIQDSLVTGNFYFSSVALAIEAVNALLELDLTTNGEFYLDDAAGLLASRGFKVCEFEVDDYLSFGTPEELETFRYWQLHFHQDPNHPYHLELEEEIRPCLDREGGLP